MSVGRQLARAVPSHPGPPQKRAAIPYVPGVSETLARVLRSYDVQAAHVPSRKLGHELVRVKDPLKKDKFPGVVYVIPCADYPYVYVGETGNFKKRLQQHRNDVQKRHVASNALAEHCATTSNTINWDKVRVVARERNHSARLYLESLIIQTMAHTLNRNEGNLPSMYAKCLGHVLSRT